MAIPNIYTQVYGQIPEFFKTIQQGQAPAKFTQQHLKDIGFTSANHRAFIPLLKALGFLTADGSPTDRYLQYRDESQARKVLGTAVKDAYRDLFVIKAHPTDRDRELIEGKFKSTHNTTDRPAELMAKTFFSLLKLADLDGGEIELPQKDVVQNGQPITSVPPRDETAAHTRVRQLPLHYDIQIHLPPTKDVEVYNAIFKSLREHLID